MKNNKKLLATAVILIIFSVFGVIYTICNGLFMDPKLASVATDGSQLIGPSDFNQSPLNGENKPSSINRINLTEELAHQAKRKEIFEYSREGNFKDTKKRLKEALVSGLISSKEYYGELAHMLSISVDNPETIVREIVASDDNYGFEVMISLLSGNNFLADSLDSSSKKQIHDDVYNKKPEITGFISDLGLADIYRYENWIGTLKTFSQSDDNFIQNLNDIILNKITDPREAFGIHSTVENKNHLENLSKEAREKYLYYINNYIESYPKNEVASYIKSKK